MMLNALRQLAVRLQAAFNARRLDRDIEDEWESHLAMAIDDNMRRGMTPEEARRAAVVRLGGQLSLRERHRDVRGLPALAGLLQDLRFAFRLMVKERWVSAAAIVAIALGIGANTVGFTIVNAALLRGLPFDDAEELVVLSWQLRSGRRSNVSYVELEEWRAQSRTFAALGGYMDSGVSLADDRGFPAPARATWITANGFSIVRQAPLLGRDFAADDERPGADPVVILGYAIWRERYASDPNVLGRLVRINGRPATVVGVMPQGMEFPESANLWLPFIPTDAQAVRNVRPLRVFGRIASGVDLREARAELRGIGGQLIGAYPDMTRDIVDVRVETFSDRYIGGAGRTMFKTVMGAVIFVLLIACANVATLLLSRSGARAREVAARMALGATRWRLVRQLLVESLVLGFVGGALGLFLASAGVRLFDAAMQQTLPYWVRFTFDTVVFAYVAGICVLTAILFGLAPALHVSKANASEVLKEGGRGTAGSGRVRRLSGAMIVAELALTIVLLVGASLMIQTFFTLYATNLGIDIDRLMATRVQLVAPAYRNPESRHAFFSRLEAQIASVPGVEAVAVTNGVPPHDGGERGLEIEGRLRPPDTPPPFVGTVTVTPRFFDVLGVRLVRGRPFTVAEGAPGSESVIVNDHLAARFFPGEDPIGRRIRFAPRSPQPGTPSDVWRTIVGVTPLIKQGSSMDEYINAVVYIPFRQESPASASLLIRSALPPETVLGAVRRELQRIDADQPALQIQTLAQILAEDRWWQRTWSTLFGALATIGLILSTVGLYAVMAYAVTQRTQEIGVRVALGAQRRHVLWLVLRRTIVQMALGLTLGLAGAGMLARVLPSLIVIGRQDAITVGSIALLLILVGAAGCLQPARRAARVDPVIALRTD
jgi:putative ABC transport system permease protein